MKRVELGVVIAKNPFRPAETSANSPANASQSRAQADDLLKLLSWVSRQFSNTDTFPPKGVPSRDCNSRTDLGARIAGARVLWPQHEPLYDLMCLRAQIGPAAFASEKQGDPVNPEQCEWDASYFDYSGFWFEEWPEGLLKTIALDPSKGKDAKAGDYSAFVLLGLDKAGYLYCEADIRHRPSPEIVAEGIEQVRKFKPEGFAIETNQYQELLAAEFMRAASERQLLLPLWAIDNQVNKNVRIRRIGPYLAQRKLRFKRRSPGTALLIEQLRDFPVGDHDDGPDALEMALRLLIELHNNPETRNVSRRLITVLRV